MIAERPRFRDRARLMSLTLDEKELALRKLYELVNRPVASSAMHASSVLYGAEEAITIMQGHNLAAGKTRMLHALATKTNAIDSTLRSHRQLTPSAIDSFRTVQIQVADELLFAIGQLAVEAHYETGGGYGSAPTAAAA